MADGIQVNSSVGTDGNSYTTSISNDQLTTDDFLKLMIQQLKLQDPTKPMDSKEMLSTQMQMSTINTNQELIKAMQTIQTTFSQTALSNATGMIGKNIEDANVGSTGITKAYTVRSVANNNGEIQLTAQEILYLEEQVITPSSTDSTKNVVVNYNTAGEILDDNGNKTGNKIVLTNPGQPLVSNGALTVLDANNNKVTNKYSLSGVTIAVYSDQMTTIPFSSVTKVF